jgi:hypothetical protein
MKTMRGLRVAVVSISAAMALALVGQAEKAMAVGQQDPGQQEKHAAELALVVPTERRTGEGQEAQQKVMLELVAPTPRW